MSHQQLNNEFDTNSRVLLTARGYVSDQVSNKKVKTIKLSSKSARKMSAQERIAANSKRRLDQTLTLTKYPKQVQQYNDEVIKYVDLVTSNKVNRNKLNSQFHKATLAGAKVDTNYSKKTSKLFNVVIVADEASGYKPLAKTKGLTIKKAKNSSKDGKTVTTDPNKSYRKFMKRRSLLQKQRTDPLVIGLEILSLVSALLIIFFIFLQPSKQDDAMNALSESGGASLFTRPKPRGYALFLIRATEVSTAIVLITLIVVNMLLK